MKSTNRTLAFVVVFIMTACSSSIQNSDGEPCDCSLSHDIPNQLIIEKSDIPNDLTCIVANRGTVIELIDEIENLYNELNRSQVELNENDTEFKYLKIQIESWLGGAFIGNCGNLKSGLEIKEFDQFGESVDISIKTINVKLTGENGDHETAPYWYQANVAFSVRIISKNKSKASSKAVSHIVVSTCNRYLEAKK